MAHDPDDAALRALEREAAAAMRSPGGGDDEFGDLDADMEAEMAREEAHLAKLLSDPAYAARLAAQAAGEGDGDFEGGGGEIHDDDVLGELAELEGQVHAERGAGGSGAPSRNHSSAAADEFDEDAMLAEAEAEAERLAQEEERAAAPAVPARPQQPSAKPQQQKPPQQQPAIPPRVAAQQVTSSAANMVAPPAAVSTPASELASLQAQLLELKKKAVAFKQAGQQAQAIEVLRNVKTVQARIEELNKTIAAAATTTGPNVTTAAPSRPNVPARPAQPAAAAATAAAAAAAVSPSIVSSPGSSGASSNGGKLSVRASLEYDDLLSKLDAQIASLTASMKTVVAEGGGATIAPGSKQAKLVALQYFRAKTRSSKDRDLVLLARSRQLKPPTYNVEELPIQSELSFPELGEDEVSVRVLAAKDLRNPAVVSDPRDTNAFVTVHLDYATDMDGTYRAQPPLHTHTSKSKGSAPRFEQTLTVPFPCSRSPSALQRDRTILKRLMRSKLVFTVWHKRFLLGALEVGRADVKLKEMSLKSELKLSLKLKDEKSGVRAGELEVEIRLKKPFEGMDLRTNNLPLIVVDEFEEEEPQQQQQSQHAPAAAAAVAAPVATQSVQAASSTASSAASAAPAAPAAPAAAPSAAGSASNASGVDLSDPHEILKMRSNDVLEAEIVLLQAELAAAQARGAAGAEDADAAQDRLTAAQVQLQVLVTQVQNGKLTLEEYLQGLRTAIVSEGTLAIALNKAGRKADALRVMQRVKIMKAEVQNAEENQEELEQC